MLTAGLCSIARGQKKEEPPKIPDPKTVVCKAADGLLIRCTYYYGCTDPEKKKNTVPVIIVHDYQEQARDYDGLATYLQHQGHAVIVPDLRGHGGSKAFEDGTEFTERELERSLRASVMAMVADVEAAKGFLMQENNRGELNIELLTVIGVGDMGSVVAINWTASDWNWPEYPGRKQGKDVKALCLLSPAQSFKGATAREALTNNGFLQNKHPIHSSVALIVGRNDRTSSGETRRIYDALERSHEINKELFKVEKETLLSGRKMLDPALRLGTEGNIAKFIELTVQANVNQYPWRMR
jgi:alpha-beta hydrolase superfamily lysophospholipase